jgi:phosphatidylglycerol:prolipoprotein diacylglycerol transferase
MYGLMIDIGLVAGIAIAVLHSRKYSLKPPDVLFASLFGCVGLLIGAKLLYIITLIPPLVTHWRQVSQNPAPLVPLLVGGFVFYGGLLGAVAGIYIYCRRYRLAFLSMMDIITPSIPIIHGFGRLGCFFAGCCYGIPYSGPGHIIFPHSGIAPGGIALFPTQLLESGMNFLAGVLLLLYAKPGRRPGKVSGIYIVYYAVTRFLIEFLRGDAGRGFLFGISTSQWISIVLLPFGIRLLLRKKTGVK